MVYVDENLCTGCGICLDACNRGAISLEGSAATIDEALCTSCGRCIDVCLTGAIIALEVEPDEAAADSLGRPVGTPTPAGSSLVPAKVPSTTAAMPPSGPATPVPATRSRLGMVEQVVSGLVGLVGYALEIKRSLSAGSSDPAAGTGSAVSTQGGARGSGLGPGRSRGSKGGQGGGQQAGCGKGLRGGRGPGGGRGAGGGRGRDNRCGAQRGDRTS